MWVIAFYRDKYPHGGTACLVFILGLNVWADEDNEENEQFGDNKAITAIRNEGEEFKLSKESVKTLGLIFIEINIDQDSKNIIIPKESLNKYMNIRGVYINRDGWFKLLKLKILKKHKDKLVVSIRGIMKSDKLVVTNVGLLRVAHIHASGGLRGVDLDWASYSRREKLYPLITYTSSLSTKC